MSVEVAHTADLGERSLSAARRLLDDVFPGEMTDDDWEHALGGVHALSWDGPELVAHASVVMRRLVHGGRALRAGYVEAVGVSPGRQGLGHGGLVMEEVERVVRAAYDLGALGSTDEALGFYGRRGWRVWEGPLYALTPDGRQATPEEQGYVLVLPTPAVELDVFGELTCDWRDGDVW